MNKEDVHIYIYIYIHTVEYYLAIKRSKIGSSVEIWGLPRGTVGEESAYQCRRFRRWGFDPCWKDLKKEIATHISILAWKIPRTEEPGGLQYMGSQRVRHN